MEQNVLNGMYEELGIRKKCLDYVGQEIEESLKERFERDRSRLAEYNQLKVLQSHAGVIVSAISISACYHRLRLQRSGPRYPRGGLCQLYSMQKAPWYVLRLSAEPMRLHVALSGNLRPGDELLSPVGKPYDTLEEVIGIRDSERFSDRIRGYLPPGGSAAGWHF